MRPRARLLAVFLTLNVTLAVLSGLSERGGPPVIHQLNLDSEGTAANLYAAMVWGAVAALAAAQLFRSATPARGPRWLRVLAWLGAALFAALVAVEEVAAVKDRIYGWEEFQPLIAVFPMNLADLSAAARWLPLSALLAVPLLAAAGWAAYPSLRHHPALALLAVLAVTLGVGASLPRSLWKRQLR